MPAQSICQRHNCVTARDSGALEVLSLAADGAYAALRDFRMSFACWRPGFLKAMAGRCWARGRALPSSHCADAADAAEHLS